MEDVRLDGESEDNNFCCFISVYGLCTQIIIFWELIRCVMTVAKSTDFVLSCRDTVQCLDGIDTPHLEEYFNRFLYI